MEGKTETRGCFGAWCSGAGVTEVKDEESRGVASRALTAARGEEKSDVDRC
jgi:hypothetical protein